MNTAIRPVVDYTLRCRRRCAVLISVGPDNLISIVESLSCPRLSGGQRIRRAIKQLRHVETMLEGLMPGGVVPQETESPVAKLEVLGPEQTVDEVAAAGPDLGQAAIDRLLNG
jgi:hypothetical protein